MLGLARTARIVWTGLARSVALKVVLALGLFFPGKAGFLAAPRSSHAERFPASFPVVVVVDSFPTVEMFPPVWGPKCSFPWAPLCLSFRCRSSGRTPAGSVSIVFVCPMLKIVCTGALKLPPSAIGADFGLPFARGAVGAAVVLGADLGLPLSGFIVGVAVVLPL